MANTLQEYSDKLEKILCKYMDFLDEGLHLSGYDMADLIREVSGNELDARFVELYLKYVDTGRGGKILKWDITSPYNEDTSKMRKIVSERKIKHWQGYGTVDAKLLKKTPDEMVIQVSGMHEYGLDCDKYDTYRVYEWLVKRFDPTKTERDIQSVDIDDDYERRGNVDIEVCTYTIHFGRGGMWQESADATLKDIERTYGKKTALALDKYCKLFKKNPTNVVSDMKMDGNGMTEWDKFDVWAQRKLKVDIMDNFDDTVDWTGADDDRKREKEFDDADKKEERKAARKAKRAAKRLLKKKQHASHALHTHDTPHFNEGSGSNPCDEYFISHWIGEQLSECEWAQDVDYGDFPILVTTDAGQFKVTVEPM